MAEELRECGEKAKDEDLAFTVLLGLGERFSPLVVTLTNMSSKETPLLLNRVCEQVLTEELRFHCSFLVYSGYLLGHSGQVLSFRYAVYKFLYIGR